MGIKIETGNRIRPIPKPRKKPINIKRKTDKFKLPISSLAPERSNTSKNINMANIINGKRQIFILFDILLMLENFMLPNIKANPILKIRATKRKISGSRRLKKVLPIKSIMLAIIIGIML